MMESLRILQRQMLQQFLRTRPIRGQLRHVSTQTPSPLNHIYLRPKVSAYSFSFPLRASPGRAGSYAGRFRQASRGFSSSTEAPSQHLSLSQRLKKLSREYGWTALGVYLLLSALDFPFCFMAVRWLGTDRVGHWEHVIVSKIKEVVKWPFDNSTREAIDGAVHEVATTVQKKIPVNEVRNAGEQRMLEEDETYVVVDHGFKEATAANRGANASIWTQLALAYAIHKSFIFIRVPLTAAILPKVVKTLRSWGYNIGKMPKKRVPAANTPSGSSGVNTKGSGVKSE